MGRGPPPPGCWGGALGRGGSRVLGYPTRRLPSLPHLGSGKPETLARGWPGRLLHWESCRGSEPGRGIQLPFFRLPESRLSSGGWTSALASSLPAGRLAACGCSWAEPAPSAAPAGWRAQGAGGPRRARVGSREGLAIRWEGWEGREAQGARGRRGRERRGGAGGGGRKRFYTEA